MGHREERKRDFFLKKPISIKTFFLFFWRKTFDINVWKRNEKEIWSCVIKKKGYRVRIPFDGQHNRDNQNGFIRFTTFCPWFGKRHEFFPSKRKNGIFSTREKTALIWKRWKWSRAFLWLSIGPFFCLCSLSPSLPLSLSFSHSLSVPTIP